MEVVMFGLFVMLGAAVMVGIIFVIDRISCLLNAKSAAKALARRNHIMETGKDIILKKDVDTITAYAKRSEISWYSASERYDFSACYAQEFCLTPKYTTDASLEEFKKLLDDKIAEVKARLERDARAKAIINSIDLNVN